jgi:DNA-3-methyladenine glycosylase I
VASYDDARLASLMENTGIVRNRLKIEATRTNARAAVALREDGGLEDFIASYRPERTPAPETTDQVPTTSPESLALSKALKKKGFTFVGPTTMHALMEATGLVDTHLVGCHRRGIGGVWA